jgi:hypothetical protein
VTRLKKEKKVNLKKERKRSHKIILNTLIIRNKDITQRTVIRNPNKTKQPKQRVSFKIKNKNPNRKSILKENKMKPDDNLRKKLSLK